MTIELAQPQHPHADRTIAAAFDEMLRLERLLSHHDASSALSRLNRAAGQGPQVVPAELLGMLTLAQAAAVRTAVTGEATAESFLCALAALLLRQCEQFGVGGQDLPHGIMENPSRFHALPHLVDQLFGYVQCALLGPDHEG
ncbi:MAG: FAD:protein FMN transferase [Burkholderiaceae bacterium]|nr:FAD:protein FMN transferase [Burkholderiaceae bacterium]